MHHFDFVLSGKIKSCNNYFFEMGTTLGLMSSLFAGLYSQSRLYYAMSRDGFLYHKLAKLNSSDVPQTSAVQNCRWNKMFIDSVKGWLCETIKTWPRNVLFDGVSRREWRRLKAQRRRSSTIPLPSLSVKYKVDSWPHLGFNHVLWFPDPCRFNRLSAGRILRRRRPL